jgi:conjugative relaxase-like TrwC/TraI family protein
VLSIGKLAPGQHDYYLDTVARGAEEYYTAAGEVPGRWTGRSVRRLGLVGEVTAEDLGAVLSGRAPDGGERLVAAQGGSRTPGFDCTFSAPKSVSLLWALGPPEVARHVREAHDAAVDAAIAVLEDEASRARRGRGGLVQVDAEGFVAAAFRHRTSRAGDPQLHTHVLVANLAHVAGEDRWTALDARPLYAWAKTAGCLYEAQLRAELTRRLGVEWTQPVRGIAEIAGIPKPVLRHFSRRRQQVEAHLAEVGFTSGKAAQVATYATRPAKDRSTSSLSLWKEWRERAEALGLDEDRLATVRAGTARYDPVEPGSTQARAMFARLALASGITEQRSTFNRRDAIQNVCDLLPDGADTREALALADAFLGSRNVVHLASGDTDRLRRGDGKSAPIPTDPRRFTTREMVQTEGYLLHLAASRCDAGAGLAHPGTVADALARRPSLSDEQVAMVQRICRSGAGVDVIVGVAGAGKTSALTAAYDAWTSSGHRVIGATLAARAARQLEVGSGIRSSTLTRLLADLNRPDGGRLGPDHVVVVDEASMVCTRKLLRLVRHSHSAGAKVVLIGDPCQLPEIEAGGVFAGLARRGDRTALRTNRRQHEPWERQALSDIRLGRAEEAVAAYVAHGRIHHDPDPDVVRGRMIDDWWTATSDGVDVLMLAAHHRQVDALNQRARQRMRAAGRLGQSELQLGGGAYAAGDIVLALRNDYRLGLLNGTRGTITAIDEHARRFEVATDEATTVTIPFAYAEAGNLTYGYATTIHKAEGATVAIALVLADATMTRQHLYTAVSRGSQRNGIYLSTDDLRADIAHVAEAAREPIQVLIGIIDRADAKEMAIEAPQLTL